MIAMTRPARIASNVKKSVEVSSAFRAGSQKRYL